MMSENIRKDLAPRIRALRIIVFALAMGVLSFAIVAVVQNVAKPQNLGTNLQLVPLPISALLLVGGFVVPTFLPKIAPTTGPGTYPAHDPESNDALRVFAAMITATIVGCAMFEGAAFMNLVWYFLHAELVHAALATVCWVCILLHFPLTERIVQKIEERLQKLKEEESLGR